MDEEGNESRQALHFFYDSQSKPAFVEFEGERYRYVHSLQGDIIAIVDSVGNTVVEYKYDAWGKPASTNSIENSVIGDINPFRYRGYIYDNETIDYYLRNRYYSANRGRFLNADEYMGDGLGNLFAYTCNAVVTTVDSNGSKTYSIGSVTTLYVGYFSYSVARGTCWDDMGNEGEFVTYGGLEGNYIKEKLEPEYWPENFSTATVGFASASGVGFYAQTNLESIEQLKGISCSAGISWKKYGFDLLYEGTIKEANDDSIIGWQISYGFSKGMDVGHLSNQFTDIIITKRARGANSKGYSNKRGKSNNAAYRIKKVYDPLLGYYRYVRIYS